MGRYDILLGNDARSAFRESDQPRKPRRTSQPSPETNPQPDRPPDRSIPRPPERTPVRRTLGRVAFEFYMDQVEALRRMSLEQKMHGEKGSMSEMVRDAIDQYLAKQPHKKS